jgi:hypothetical protein
MSKITEAKIAEYVRTDYVVTVRELEWHQGLPYTSERGGVFGHWNDAEAWLKPITADFHARGLVKGEDYEILFETV